MVAFGFILTIFHSFSISYTHLTLNLNYIQNCDLQVRSNTFNSTFIFENEVMIEKSSEWTSQNTWNLGGEMIDYYYESSFTASLDFPFRFREKLTIVIAEDDLLDVIPKKEDLISKKCFVFKSPL